MNLEFLIVALVMGRAVDWIFQTKWQAKEKTTNVWMLIEHSLFYSICTVVIVSILLNPYSAPWAGYVWLMLFISHMIIDNRYLVKVLMYLKGMTWEEVNSKEYAWLQVGIDQRLHDVVMVLIAMAI